MGMNTGNDWSARGTGCTPHRLNSSDQRQQIRPSVTTRAVTLSLHAITENMCSHSLRRFVEQFIISHLHRRSSSSVSGRHAWLDSVLCFNTKISV